MDRYLDLIGRNSDLFSDDLSDWESDLSKLVRRSRFLVVGGGGSIGQAVCKEIFRRDPEALHVVDLSENSLVELVRDIRSSLGYIRGDFRTFAVDVGSVEFRALFRKEGPYDYILNLSALKHVRSEKDPYTLMRMVQVNVLNTEDMLVSSIESGVRKYFCVSTDKATNPVNMMGCSKRIMEMFLLRRSTGISVSTARFANVAFSDGSLLHGFRERLKKRQPISAPSDIRRYFITPKESGQLCLMSCLLGDNKDIFFPKLEDRLHLVSFQEIAERYLKAEGFEPVLCSSEDEARRSVEHLAQYGKWPCYFSPSDTTGEKPFEEFYGVGQVPDMERFNNIGVVGLDSVRGGGDLDGFLEKIRFMKNSGAWSKDNIVELFKEMVPEFTHLEKGKYLDEKM